MGSKRKYMLLIIALLAIGFSATTTTIYLNGSIGLLANTDDFTKSVIFKSVTPASSSSNEKGGTATVSTDGKTVTFTANNLSSVGDTSTMDFEIANNSTQYDATASIECTLTDSSYSDYISITTSPDSFTVASNSTTNGQIQVKYKETSSSEITATFKCEIVASATERTSSGTTSSSDVSSSYSLTAVYEDESGNAVGNAVLVVASDPQVVTTDSDGSFTVNNLEVGTHHAYYMGTTSEVTASDYESKTLEEIKEAAKDTSTFIVGETGTITLSSDSRIKTSINLYNMIKLGASTDTIDFDTDSGTSGTNGIYTTTETDSGAPVYYYRGNVNNNIIFNNICWKMIRTTETGGVKLIYNGEVSLGYANTKVISSDNYSVTNDETYPFAYSDGKWTSTNKENSTTSTIEITNLSGDYLIGYTTSTEKDYDEMNIYLNDTLLKTISGEKNDEYSLLNLKNTDIIKIQYEKDDSEEDGSDEITFSIEKNDKEDTVVSKDNYSVTNDETYPYKYSNGTWTSTNKEDSTTSTIEITKLSGNYIVEYTVSSEEGYDELEMYLNDILVKNISGEKNGIINLEDISLTDEIKIQYVKDSSSSKKNDEISFNILKESTNLLKQCKAQDDGAEIDENSYNASSNDNAYVGYMYGKFTSSYTDTGKSSTSTTSSLSSTSKYYYGTSYTFYTSNGYYSLSNTTQGTWSSDYVGYYTCFYTSNSTCQTLYYIDSYTDETHAVVYPLTKSYKGTTSYDEAHTNTVDSAAKKLIDNWYSTTFNSSTVTSKIEDTIYCNDRSTVSGGTNNSLSSATYGTLGYGQNPTGYGTLSRSSSSTNVLKPSLKCTNANDKFTVSTSNGNGALTYPVGLITSDEAVFAGITLEENEKNYLTTSSSFMTMSPVYVTNESNQYNIADINKIDDDGTLYSSSVSYSTGVRPVISLKSGVTVKAGGKGTTTNPYIVE